MTHASIGARYPRSHGGGYKDEQIDPVSTDSKIKDSAGNEIPGVYRWLVAHRRLALAVAAGSLGFVSLVLGWWGVTNTVQVADQLTYIASGGLFGLFLLGVAAIAYWGEQREREVSHLIEMQLYLSAIAESLGLTESREEREPRIAREPRTAREPRADARDQPAPRPTRPVRAPNGAPNGTRLGSGRPTRTRTP